MIWSKRSNLNDNSILLCIPEQIKYEAFQAGFFSSELFPEALFRERQLKRFIYLTFE